MMGMSFRVEPGGIVDVVMVKSFEGQTFPMHLPGGRTVDCLCIKAELIQEEGRDIGITLTMETPDELKEIPHDREAYMSIGFKNA